MQQGIAYPSQQFKNLKLDNTKKEHNTENKKENEDASNNVAENKPVENSNSVNIPTQNKPIIPNTFNNKRNLNI